MSNISFLQEEINGHLQTLESKYIEFIKEFNEYNSMKVKVVSGSRREYNRMKDELNTKKNEISQLIENLNAAKNYLENADISDNKLRTQVNKKLKMFNSKFPDKVDEYENITNEINDLEKKYSEEGSLADSYINGGSIISQSSDNGSISSINGDKVQIHDYKDTYLEQRQIEIENVKKVSAKVAEISSSIKENVFAQGEMMNDIENNIVEVNENTKKADKEIKEVEQITKKQNKRICILILIMLFLVSVIGYLITKYLKSWN